MSVARRSIRHEKVKIPEVYEDLCTERVLVIEQLFGSKLDEISSPGDIRRFGLEPEELARRMLRLQVKQAYQYGLLHADMHPGNVFILDGGRIGLIDFGLHVEVRIDFGLHVEVRKEVRDVVLRLLRLRAAGRYDEAVDAALILMGRTSRTDVEGFRRAYIALAKAKDSLPLSENSVGRALIEESRLGAQFELIAPSEMLAIARGLLIIDGICMRFCPTFKPYVEIAPIIEGIMRDRFSVPALVEQAKALIPDLLEAIERNPEFSRGMLRMRHNFSAARNLRDFLEREGFVAKRSRSWGISVWLVLTAFALGAITATFFARR